MANNIMSLTLLLTTIISLHSKSFFFNLVLKSYARYFDRKTTNSPDICCLSELCFGNFTSNSHSLFIPYLYLCMKHVRNLERCSVLIVLLNPIIPCFDCSRPYLWEFLVQWWPDHYTPFAILWGKTLIFRRKRYNVNLQPTPWTSKAY